MTYNKPELLDLGDANAVIQGSKSVPPENGDITKVEAPAFETGD